MLTCILTKNVITSCIVIFLLLLQRPLKPTLFPYTTLFRSTDMAPMGYDIDVANLIAEKLGVKTELVDRKSTRLNSSHVETSYAVFCWKKKTYAHLHTDQERDYFMQRYHDVISSFVGKTSYD